MQPSLSVVIPVCKAATHLRRCLDALRESSVRPLEVIVVDDASPDESAAVAEKAGARVIRNAERRGPAYARNRGAESARGEILVFVDADVCVHPDALERIGANFREDQELDAVFGSYDGVPDAGNFISCYKNFQHHFVHQSSSASAVTFWSGCGAVRRRVFLQFGGFSTQYRRPAIEDIEFGSRLAHAGCKIRLDKRILVTHLKLWTLGRLIRTDVLDRAIPWTRLLVADGRIPNDLNLQFGQRVSGVLAVLLVVLFCAGSLTLRGSFAAPLLSLIFLLLACYWTDEVSRGRGAGTTVAVLLLLSSAMWAASPPHKARITVPMIGAYALLYARNRLHPRTGAVKRITGVLIGCYMAVTAIYLVGFLPAHWLTAAVVGVTGAIVGLNLSFYLLLAQHWGGLYAISAVPFHVLYLLYSTAGFLAGIAGHCYGRGPQTGAQARCPILEVHLDRCTTPDMQVGRASTALVIFRYRGAVVGQRELPVIGGVVSSAVLRECIPEMAAAIWEHAVREHAAAAPVRATVVVCTRDRTEDMARCLRSLAPIVEAGHELLVIDSCPSDSRTEWLVSGYPGVRYVRESRPGAGIARNRGLIEASCDVIAFTDDDAKVDPLWLDNLLRNFEDPVTALVTGLTLPVELETESQLWFERTNGFHRGFRRREFTLCELNPVLAGLTGASVNMAVRRSVLPEVGLFDEALGPGTLCRSGEDHEFFYRVLARGHRIVYDPSALVWHRHRREWASLRKTIYGYGVGVYAWWTRAVALEGEWALPALAAGWFCRHHATNLVRAILRRKDHLPLDLAWAEFSGALAGPAAYFRSRGEHPPAADYRASMHAAPEDVDVAEKSVAP